MDKNLFVFVTKNGVVYDRTNGKNKRMMFNERYPMMVGEVEFISENEQIFVRRFGGDGKEIFCKKITETGMHLISSIFVQALPKSPKEVRNLYNRLKISIGKPHFKIETNEKIRVPYKVKLHTWIDMKFNYRFIITVKESDISLDTVNEIYSLVERASKLNLKALLEYYNAFDTNDLIVTLNEEFLQQAEYILSSEKHIASGLETS